MKLFNLSKTDKKEKCRARRCKEDHTGEVPGDLWGIEKVNLCDRHLNEAITFADKNPDYTPPDPLPGPTTEVTDKTLADELKAQAAEGEEVRALLEDYKVNTQQDVESATEILQDARQHCEWLETREKEITGKIREMFRGPRLLWAEVAKTLVQKMEEAKGDGSAE